MAKATDEQVKQLEEDLKRIAEIDVSHVVARPALGAVNFEAERGVFEEAVQLAQEWVTFPISLAPQETLNALATQFASLRGAIENVESFQITGVQNPEAERDGRLQQVRKSFDQIENAVFSIRPALAVLSADFREPLRQARQLITNARTEVTEEVNQVQAMREEMEQVLRSARETAKREGVQNFAPLFEELATENMDESNWWLRATAGLGIATAAAAAILLIWLPAVGKLADAGSASILISKAVIISLMYFATVWSSRNYRALRHQRTVNQHRHKALMTFQTFVSGGELPETRDAVLREATRCVFTPAASGYLRKEDDAPPSNVIEVMQRAARGGGTPSS